MSPERPALNLGDRFRRLIRDYFRIRDAYYEAIRSAQPFQIETVDMARRGMHNEAAELLRTRLQVALDHQPEHAPRATGDW